jgi:magnesium-transporting ATPase (P-type)
MNFKGIGIYGNEGMRAVQASDFAVGEFQCIWRLFLVHGRWSYIRISEMILYFFYKNMLFTVPQFYFAFFSSFTGQTVFDDWYISLYNLIFTALPLIIRAIFEQDVNYKVLIKKKLPNLKDYIVEDAYLKNQFPKIYATGQMKSIFNASNFFSWVCQGIVQGGFYFLIFYYLFVKCIINTDGHNGDLWGFSITFFSTIITVCKSYI